MNDKFLIEHNSYKLELFRPSVDDILKGGHKMDCNKKLAEYLVEHGITQKFLCEKTGISSEKMSYILNSKRKVTGDELISICKVLGIDLDYFKA